MPIDAALPQLWVDQDDAAPRARAIIDEYLRASSSGPPRACPACGEDNPPAFDFCWSCRQQL